MSLAQLRVRRGHWPCLCAEAPASEDKQLGFLRHSCESFDQGYNDEAIRIVTVLRVLMHDTTDRKGRPRSVSLLTHLGAKDKIWLGSTCHPPAEGVIEFYGMGRRLTPATLAVTIPIIVDASTGYRPPGA